jgi:predicted outer membrane repeat protein
MLKSVAASADTCEVINTLKFRSAVIGVSAAAAAVGIVALGSGSPASAAVISVDTVADSSNVGSCSLRDAVEAADTDTAVNGCIAGAGADVINLISGTYVLSSSSGPLVVDAGVSFTGAGTSTTIIDGAGSGRIITATAPISLSNLTLRNGAPVAADGGAISSTDTVTVANTVFSGNTAAGGAGGAIFTTGSVSVANSVFQSNVAGISGGAINAQSMNITRSAFLANRSNLGAALSDAGAAGVGIIVESSTFDANVTPATGGAIYTTSDSSRVRLSTFAANQAPAGNLAAGANIFVDTNGIVDVVGNILGLPASGSSCAGAGVIASSGANVSEEATDSCNLIGPADVVATAAQLGALQVNAPGTTPTRSISPISPAIDRVPVADCDPATLPAPTDQRSVVRASSAAGTGLRCDSGSYELSRFLGSVTVGFLTSDTALIGQAVPFSVDCPGAFGSPFAGSAAVNGANFTFAGIDAGTTCTVTPTYPAGMSGAATFVAPVTVANDTVVVSGNVSVTVVPTTTPAATIPTATLPGGGLVIGGGGAVTPNSTIAGAAGAATTTATGATGSGALATSGSNVDGLVAFACAMLLFGAALMVLRKPTDRVESA